MNSKPKILIVCQHFWPESFRINDIANYLVEKNCDIDVLCGIPNYPEGRFYEGYSGFRNRVQKHEGINIRRAYEVPRGSNTNLRIFLNYISFPVTSLFHIPRLLTKKYDKIFLYQLSPVMMSIAGIIVGKIKKTETIMYVLDLWPENLFSVLDIKNPILRSFVTSVSHWHYRHVDKLIVLSEKMKLKIVEITSIYEDKIIVVPQTAEKIYEREIIDKDMSKRFKNKFNIVYAGNISPAQSFATIIDAAKTLKAKGFNDFNWIIVGDGMSRRLVEKQVIQNGLQDVFVFEGHKPIEEIPRYTTIADVLVGCLVRSDLLEATIPAKVMSYLAAGRPVVLAMDGEVQALVNTEARCGFAGDAGDTEAFLKNILRVYKLKKEQRDELGSNAKKYYFKYFEREILLNKIYRFISY
jgi:colanic acid biosynthesis glycosyl transferase WcaI